jgi:predicted PurR-regulated permease PerM
MLAYDYPILGVFWTITFFFLWAAWIFAVIWVFIDNFRRRDHSGWAKALWAIVIIFVPIIGVFAYIIGRPTDLATA